MEGPWSAPQPHQVIGMAWRFAGPTSGTVACSHSSLDSQLDHLACACRLQNNVDDLLQEPLKIISGLHEHGRLGPASFHINFLCYQQAVRSADLASDQCHEALPDHHHCVLIAIAHVLAGGGSCFEIFNPTVLLASR